MNSCKKELALFTLALTAANAPLLCGRICTALLFVPARVAEGEWWRVLTGPLVHVSAYHLLLDAGAFLMLYRGLRAASAARRLLTAAACAAGALVNLAGVELDGGSARLFDLLAVASLPLGLLCVGAALQPRELRAALPTLLGACAVRLLGMPALAFGIARLLGLAPLESAVLILFFALPTAPTAYVLTRQLGGDSHLMAGLITLQTLLAGASLLGLLWLIQAAA
jgi:hypothetical protein